MSVKKSKKIASENQLISLAEELAKKKKREYQDQYGQRFVVPGLVEDPAKESDEEKIAQIKQVFRFTVNSR